MRRAPCIRSRRSSLQAFATKCLVLVCLLCTSTALLLLVWPALIVQRRENRAPHTTRVPCTLGTVLQEGVCIQCPRGKFSLADWVACQPLLACEEVRHEINKRELLHSLVHWRYYRAEWKGYEVIYATFSTLALSSVNYDTIGLFPLSPNTLYPIGACEDVSVVIFAANSTYVEVGNHLNEFISKYPLCDTCLKKFQMAMGYVRLLVQLHAVNTTLCNSRTLSHFLSQFLITDDCTLVLATLDNLPQDTCGPILCHQRELRGRLVAPEQLWPYGVTKIFNPDEQPKYDKTTDIWKVPQVVSYLLTPDCTNVLDYLSGIHSRCKDRIPHKRPTALELLLEYGTVLKLLFT